MDLIVLSDFESHATRQSDHCQVSCGHNGSILAKGMRNAG